MGLNVQEAVIWTQPSTPSTEKGKANLPNKFKSTPDSRTHCLLRLRSDCGGELARTTVVSQYPSFARYQKALQETMVHQAIMSYMTEQRWHQAQIRGHFHLR